MHLTRGEEVLGVLRVYEIDQPWFNCKFESTKAFEEIRPLFEAELAVSDNKWEKVYNKIIELNLELVDFNHGVKIKDFLLHIKDDKAWFRY